METEGSQEPANGLYPEPDAPNSQFRTLFL
jgi:hypothetical protein